MGWIVPFFDVKVFILIPMPLILREPGVKAVIMMQNTNNGKEGSNNSCHQAPSAMQLGCGSSGFRERLDPLVVEPIESIGYHCTV